MSRRYEILPLGTLIYSLVLLVAGAHAVWGNGFAASSAGRSPDTATDSNGSVAGGIIAIDSPLRRTDHVRLLVKHYVKPLLSKLRLRTSEPAELWWC